MTDELAGSTAVEAPEADSGRAASAISQIYYVVVAVVGVGFLLGGAISALIGVRRLALPGEFDTSREAVRSILTGLAFALPGLALAAWHLREARRREARVVPGVLWGSSLYLHLVALLSIFTVLGGTIATLGALVDLVRPTCLNDLAIPPSYGGFVQGGCEPSHGDALRSLANALIFVAAAGGVWLWHIRRGRALGTTTSAPAAAR